MLSDSIQLWASGQSTALTDTTWISEVSIKVLASNRCTQRDLYLLMLSPTASLSTKRWEADSHLSFLAKSNFLHSFCKDGDGQADRRLCSLNAPEVTRCLIDVGQKVGMPTVSFWIFVHHPSEFCRVELPFILYRQTIVLQSQESPSEVTWGFLTLCLCVVVEHLGEDEYNFHWESQVLESLGTSLTGHVMDWQFEKTSPSHF